MWCMHMGMGLLVLCLYVKRLKEDIGYFSYLLPTLFIKTGFLTELKLTF